MAAEQLVADDAGLHTARFGDGTGTQDCLDYVAFVKRAYPDPTFRWTMTVAHFQMKSIELPFPAIVRLDGSANVGQSDARITSISLQERSIAITDPQSASWMPILG